METSLISAKGVPRKFRSQIRIKVVTSTEKMLPGNVFFGRLHALAANSLGVAFKMFRTFYSAYIIVKMSKK